MNARKASIKKEYVYFIVLLQVVLILFSFSKQRGFYYWDTYYTFKTAHYISDSTPGNHYIVYDPEFKTDQWMQTEVVRASLRVDKYESILNDSVKSILQKLIHSPYWVVLNSFEAIFAPGEISGWPAIGLNVLLFLFTQTLIYLLVYKYTAGNDNDNRYASLAIVFFGFSGMTISIASYARFYIFSVLLCVAFTYMHSFIWDIQGNRWYLIPLLEIPTMLLAIWNIKMSEFSLFYVCFFVLFYLLALVLQRRFTEFFIYGIPVFIGGTWYITTQTLYLDMLFKANTMIEKSSGPTRWVLDMLLTLTPVTFAERSLHEFSLIGQFAYGYRGVFVLFAVVVIIYIVYKCCHFGGIVISPEETEKTKHFLGKLNLFSHPMEYVMLATMVGYIVVACALHFYTEVRYSCHVFPLIAWFTAVVLVRFRDEFKERRWSVIPIIVIAASVIISTVSGQRVVYVFDYGDEVVDYIDEHDINEFIVSYYGDGSVSTDIIYQSVYLFDDDDRFMAVSEPTTVKDELPDEFFFATRNDMDRVDDYFELGYDSIWSTDVGVYRFYYLIS